MCSSFSLSLCAMRTRGTPVMSETICWMSSASMTFSSLRMVLSHSRLMSSTRVRSCRTLSRTPAACS